MQRGLHVAVGVLAGFVLYSAFSSFGVAAVAVNLFTPLPAAFLGMRYGARTGITVAVLTALAVMLSSGAVPMMLYMLQFGVPGALLPWLLLRGRAWDKAVVITVGVMLLASLGGLTVMSLAEGNSPFTVVGGLIDREIEQTTLMMREVFVQTDLPADQMAAMTRSFEQMIDFMRQVYPAAVVTVSGVLVLCLILLLSMAARGRYVIPGQAFQYWKAPDSLIWLLIPAGFAVAFIDGIVERLALNMLVILLPVYFLQGLAIIDCFFRRKAFSPLFRGVGYLLVTLVNPLPMVVAGLGIFDLWADFRKPRQTES